MNVTYSFIFWRLKHFFSFLTSVSDKHGNKNKTTIVSQPWKIVLETTIKGQSFQVVLDNEAFFSCQTNGFLHCSSFAKKIQITIRHFSFSFTDKTKNRKADEAEEEEWSPVFKTVLTFTLKSENYGLQPRKISISKRDHDARISPEWGGSTDRTKGNIWCETRRVKAERPRAAPANIRSMKEKTNRRHQTH